MIESPYTKRPRLSTLNNDESLNKFTTEEQTCNVILVDTHKLVRQVLQRSIVTFSYTHIAASLSTMEDVTASIDKYDPTTIVLGPSIPVSDCLYLLKILERYSTCGLVVIQQCLHPETALTLVKKGICGLLDEGASEQDLANAIASASQGNTYLSRGAHSILMTSMSRSSTHLTEREVQVLSLLKHGESNFRIAHALGLKEKTIEKYLTNIYDKLQVRSRAETISYIQKFHI